MWLRRPAPEPRAEAVAEAPLTPAEAAWPFNADSPVIARAYREDRFLQVMLVDVSGLEWESIAERLDMIHAVATEKRMVPVLVVDLVDFAGLRATGLAYDCLPNAAANAPLAPELDWLAYVGRRRALLREKWRPAAIVLLGPGRDWDQS